MIINSYEKSTISGFLNGVIQVILLTIFSAVILYLTRGEHFVYKEGVHSQIGNIRLDDVDKVGYILATVVPLVLLRYNSIKYLPLHIVSSVASYCISFFIFDYILFKVFHCM